MKRLFPIITILFFTAIGSARAATSLGVFSDWEAYTERDDGKLVCFMGSEPTKMTGNYKVRGKSFVLVTHRPKDKSKNVVSIQAGYTYKDRSEAVINIDGDITTLFVSDRHAYAIDAKADNTLVKSMIKNTSMTVKGTSSRGTLTTDTYSLKGFTAAYKAISAACRIK